ncbi:MAG: O-antigen ligase family protein [Reyranellaceae bacterium]
MSRIVFWALVGLVVLSPLPLASNRPVPWTALALCTGILLILWAVTALRSRPRGARAADRFLLPAALLYGAALGWMLVQSLLPFPAEWQPEALQRAHDLLEMQGAAGLGLDPGGAWHVLLRLGTYAGVFLLAWEFGRRRARAQAMLVAVVLAGAAYALYGLIVHLGGYQMVLWYPKTAYGDGLTSTFINRNNYATYAGLGALCALALMFGHWRRRQDRRRFELARAAAPEPGSNDWPIAVLALAAGMIAAALVLTGSRGGFYALAITLSACVALLAAARLVRGWQLMGLLGIGAAAAIVLLLAVGGGLAGRLETAAASIDSSRGDIFGPTIAAIRVRPLTGYGAGSFQGVFEAVNTGELYRQGYSIDKAHDTYLELALEAGIPAAAAMVLAVLAFVALCVLALLRRKAVRFALAGTAASLMVGVHALVDFSLQMPAVAVTYAAVLGVCAAQCRRRLSQRAD